MKKACFILPSEKIYLCGHSLGPITYSAQNKINEVIEEWKKYAVNAWDTCGWMEAERQIAFKIGKLIGAKKDTVAVSDSTSVNLFKVLYSAYALNPKKSIILTDEDNFPTDLYIAQGFKKINNKIHIKYINRKNIFKEMNENISVLWLTHINYRTGEAYDMAAVTQLAHRLGITVVWDLSHSAGIVPIDLDSHHVDFAVGCTYKYLNGGPGAPSYLYINEKHHRTVQSPITGWMGHQQPFTFEKKYRGIPHAAKYLVGTPYVLSLKGLEGALEVYDDLNMNLIDERRIKLSEFMRNHIHFYLPTLKCVSPLDPKRRGGHLAYYHPNADAIVQVMIHKGVICDYRAPQLMRFSINPLYISKDEIIRSINILTQVLTQKLYLSSCYQIQKKVI